jgi:GMP synthase (glutamine-hydrolysing)
LDWRFRAVTSAKGVPAAFYHFDAQLLESVATRISDEVRGINCVAYTVTPQPPALFIEKAVFYID